MPDKLDAPLVEKIINKYREDRIRIKEMKARHAEELRELEVFQSRRETALIEHAGIEAFAFMTDLYLNGRDGKSELKKTEENIALNQTKLEAWLLKQLSAVGEGIKTEFGTVFKTRKESVTCSDFDMFVTENMVKPVAEALLKYDTELNNGLFSAEQLVQIIMENIHLELLTKAVRKESCLEIMGDQKPDGSRPNPPPAGANYTAVQTVGVRKK